ncbi:acyl-CoA dehydrogenase family protein [Kordiimonas pumila]|uniref:Acyl-CoA dehydrogenase family protein n=1 Tax=Kordiimonas pumila TaxID=2161677 RepID=A0ABV7D864_9PROT|nr:acyl-CoA dehydrogenase [Kordiimonas pumila]
MNFDFTEEQKMLVQSLERSLAKSYTFEAYREQVANKVTSDPKTWESLAELGIMAMPLPEAAGGFDGNHVDVMAVCTELGRRLVIEPYISSVVIAAYILEEADGDIAAEHLPKIAVGEEKYAAGFYEPGERHNPLAINTKAQEKGGSWVLTGRKAVVLGADTADHLIISADAGGPALFLLPADASGITLHKYPLMDGRGAADIVLEGAEATLLCASDKASAIIEAAVDRGAAALVADTLGAMEEVSELTKDYLRTRTQFGRPIGSFQVLSHRMVDLLIEYEQAKSITMEAAVEARNSDSDIRRKAVSAAKAKVGIASREFGKESIQMHGGIGMTDEYALGAYVKRMLVNEILFGDADYHLNRYSA